MSLAELRAVEAEALSPQWAGSLMFVKLFTVYFFLDSLDAEVASVKYELCCRLAIFFFASGDTPSQ